MSNIDDLEQFNKDFEELVEDLNNIYYSKTCDIFAEAKSALTKSTEDLLGEEYRTLCDELKAIKDNVTNIQGELNSDQALLKNKAHVEALKFKIAHAETEKEKLLYKAEMSLLKLAVRGVNASASHTTAPTFKHLTASLSNLS